MIRQEDIILIGRLLKPHGIHGELSFGLDISGTTFDEIIPSYLVIEMDSIFVPFFIKSYRLKNEHNGRILFEGVNTDEEAKELAYKSIFLPRELLSKDLSADMTDTLNYYIGYVIFDKENKKAGKIISIDDATENVLFNILSDEEKELMIPVSDDYIIEIDDSKKAIWMDIPEGLLDL